MPLNTKERINLIALSLAHGLSVKKMNEALEHISAEQMFMHHGWSELVQEQFPKIAKQVLPWSKLDNLLEAEQSGKFRIIAQCDEEYPELLKHISDPPITLFARGDLSLLKSKQIAIVGSRKCTSLGISTTKEYASSMAQAGLTITSGMAIGVDTAAHKGALEVGGKTIAVFGSGFDHVYPPENRNLFQQICEHGLVITEYPPYVHCTRYTFPQRNRIISGLAEGVLVVEAAKNSGSLITANEALDQGREVYAIPGSVRNPNSEGANKLIQDGATLVMHPNNIIINHGATAVCGSEPTQEEEHPLLAFIDDVCTPTDVIIARSGLSPKEIAEQLFVLELDGKVFAAPGGYQRA